MMLTRASFYRKVRKGLRKGRKGNLHLNLQDVAFAGDDFVQDRIHKEANE